MKVKVTQPCPTLCDPTDCLWNSPGQNAGLGSLSLLHQIFLKMGKNTTKFLQTKMDSIRYNLDHFKVSV